MEQTKKNEQNWINYEIYSIDAFEHFVNLSLINSDKKYFDRLIKKYTWL